MDTTFRNFLDSFLNSWRNSSIDEMKDLITQDYQAREITNGKVVDFGYQESINGWSRDSNSLKRTMPFG